MISSYNFVTPDFMNGLREMKLDPRFNEMILWVAKAGMQFSTTYSTEADNAEVFEDLQVTLMNNLRLLAISAGADMMVYDAGREDYEGAVTEAFPHLFSKAQSLGKRAAPSIYDATREEPVMGAMFHV
ncbi:hypothetical protein [Rhizobium sp. BK251]|uniref:hypothetical protein n=1 Tax=Rhizobium sp. BK251 TaxID=2512125 RepID=UPI00104CDEAC|nr:hypothetical protein [Rhizobium sp. BK251]TCL70611.1 hypothetical protein EV286_107488 [Rhizobium sp. BK251]